VAAKKKENEKNNIITERIGTEKVRTNIKEKERNRAVEKEDKEENKRA
jgi:hypothetical protein